MERAGYIAEIAKQPGEKRPFTVTYENRMPAGATVSSCAVSAVDLAVSATDNSVISGTTATVTTTTASIFVQAGTAYRSYEITFTATLSDTTVLIDNVLMQVKPIPPV